MAKLEDLNLDDSGPGQRDPVETAKAKDFLDEISELLGDPRYNWANDTLSGIFDTVEGTLRVTPGQYMAVRNIRAGGERERDRPGGSRRYEGWRR